MAMTNLAPFLTLVALTAQQPKLSQNPSPMVEHTREHPRLKEERPVGHSREKHSPI
jgi:hypothetical protein